MVHGLRSSDALFSAQLVVIRKGKHPGRHVKDWRRHKGQPLTPTKQACGVKPLDGLNEELALLQELALRGFAVPACQASPSQRSQNAVLHFTEP